MTSLDLSRTAWMLRKYAAGFNAGSGALGSTMSGMDALAAGLPFMGLGEVPGGLLPGMLPEVDIVSDMTSPFDDVFLRLKRPILKQEMGAYSEARDCDLCGP